MNDEPRVFTPDAVPIVNDRASRVVNFWLGALAATAITLAMVLASLLIESWTAQTEPLSNQPAGAQTFTADVAPTPITGPAPAPQQVTPEQQREFDDKIRDAIIINVIQLQQKTENLHRRLLVLEPKRSLDTRPPTFEKFQAPSEPTFLDPVK